jgi:hypothetical protein
VAVHCLELAAIIVVNVVGTSIHVAAALLPRDGPVPTSGIRRPQRYRRLSI